MAVSSSCATATIARLCWIRGDQSLITVLKLRTQALEQKACDLVRNSPQFKGRPLTTRVSVICKSDSDR